MSYNNTEVLGDPVPLSITSPITITPDSFSIIEGSTITFIVTINATDDVISKVTWELSAIDANSGTLTLSKKFYDGIVAYSASFSIANVSAKLDHETVNIFPYDTFGNLLESSKEIAFNVGGK